MLNIVVKFEAMSQKMGISSRLAATLKSLMGGQAASNTEEIIDKQDIEASHHCSVVRLTEAVHGMMHSSNEKKTATVEIMPCSNAQKFIIKMTRDGVVFNFGPFPSDVKIPAHVLVETACQQGLPLNAVMHMVSGAHSMGLVDMGTDVRPDSHRVRFQIKLSTNEVIHTSSQSGTTIAKIRVGLAPEFPSIGKLVLNGIELLDTMTVQEANIIDGSVVVVANDFDMEEPFRPRVMHADGVHQAIPGSSSDVAPGVGATPINKGYPIYVISLPDSEEAKKRRKQLNFPHIIVDGIRGPDVPQWIRDRFNTRCKGFKQEASMGAWAAHYSVWELIYDKGNNGGVVAEDDARLARDLPDVRDLPRNSITILGGTLRTDGTFDDEEKEYVKTGAFLRKLAGFRMGVNPLGTHKLTMALAYYIPPGMASTLIANSNITPREHKSGDKKGKIIKDLKVIDVWLSTVSGLVETFWFPNCFIDQEDSKTQCGFPVNHMKADFYMCNFMRKAAIEMGVKIPDRGASVQELVKALQLAPKRLKIVTVKFDEALPVASSIGLHVAPRWGKANANDNCTTLFGITEALQFAKEQGLDKKSAEKIFEQISTKDAIDMAKESAIQAEIDSDDDISITPTDPVTQVERVMANMTITDSSTTADASNSIHPELFTLYSDDEPEQLPTMIQVFVKTDWGTKTLQLRPNDLVITLKAVLENMLLKDHQVQFNREKMKISPHGVLYKRFLRSDNDRLCDVDVVHNSSWDLGEWKRGGASKRARETILTDDQKRDALIESFEGQVSTSINSGKLDEVQTWVEDSSELMEDKLTGNEPLKRHLDELNADEVDTIIKSYDGITKAGTGRKDTLHKIGCMLFPVMNTDVRDLIRLIKLKQQEQFNVEFAKQWNKVNASDSAELDYTKFREDLKTPLEKKRDSEAKAEADRMKAEMAAQANKLRAEFEAAVAAEVARREAERASREGVDADMS